MPEKLVIIGSGPAAFTAAVYAARANLRPVLYEGAITEENRARAMLPLGQLNLTTDVEDFPGFPAGVVGPDLMLKLREQAERYGTRIRTEDVIALGLSYRPFGLLDSLGTSSSAHAVVLATGAVQRPLELDSVSRWMNRGISPDAVSDGPLPRFRNQPLVVVGGGDYAAVTALWLTKFASHVYLLHRRDRLRAGVYFARKVLSHPKIVPIANVVVREVLGDEQHGLTGVVIRNVQSGEETTLQASGMFVRIGSCPNSSLVGGEVELDAAGYVVLKHPPHTATSVEGVFAAGEVADPVYRKAVTAAAMGCKAALDAERWLESQGIG